MDYVLKSLNYVIKMMILMQTFRRSVLRVAQPMAFLHPRLQCCADGIQRDFREKLLVLAGPRMARDGLLIEQKDLSKIIL